MNQLGLGFTFKATDHSSGVFKSIQAALGGLRSEAKRTQQELSKVQPMGGGAAGAVRGSDGRLRDADSGRFVGGLSLIHI